MIYVAVRILWAVGTVCCALRAYWLAQHKSVLAHSALIGLLVAASAGHLWAFFRTLIFHPDCFYKGRWAKVLESLLNLNASVLLALACVATTLRWKQAVHRSIIAIFAHYGCFCAALMVIYKENSVGSYFILTILLLICVSIGCSLEKAKRRQQQKSNAIVQEDKAKYDSVWVRLVSDAGFKREVDSLAALSARMVHPAFSRSRDGSEQANPFAGSLTQALRKHGIVKSVRKWWPWFVGDPAARRSSVMFADLNNTSPAERHLQNVAGDLKRLARSRSPRQYVKDLAVLFAEAAALNEHFQERVKAWAAPGGGATGTGSGGTHHHQCSVKRRRRAIQKMCVSPKAKKYNLLH